MSCCQYVPWTRQERHRKHIWDHPLQNEQSQSNHEENVRQVHPEAGSMEPDPYSSRMSRSIRWGKSQKLLQVRNGTTKCTIERWTETHKEKELCGKSK